MSMDIHALSGAYAVDAVDEFERAQFERHLAGCTDCRAEVASLREAASLVGETAAQQPPLALRSAVLAGIQTVRPLPPVLTAVERSRSARRRFPALVAAAAALIAVGGVGATIMDLANDNNDTGLVAGTATDTDRVLQAPDAHRHTKQLDGGGSVTVVRSASLNQAVILTEDMPAAPNLRTYELWLQHGDSMVPAGQIAGGTNAVLLEGDAMAADGVGITIELAGAKATQPSDRVVDVIGFESA